MGFQRRLSSILSYVAAAGLLSSSRAAPAQVQQTVHSFTGHDGFYGSRLAPGRDGSAFGTSGGGTRGGGVYFRVEPNGTLRYLRMFPGQDPGGASRYGLTAGLDGAFYGTNGESLLRYTPSGDSSIVAALSVPGYEILSPLSAGSDGNFYCLYDGPAPVQQTSIARITASGQVTTAGAPFFGALAGVTAASDGNLYGVASGDSAGDYLVIYRLTVGGQVTQIGELPLPAWPFLCSALTEEPGGNLYGTAAVTTPGGAIVGYLIRASLAGGVSVAASFPAGGPAGIPSGSVARGPDGALYGISGTPDGTAHAYRVDAHGGVTVLGTFHRAAGDSALVLPPIGDVVAGSTGVLYGTTRNGGDTVFGSPWSGGLLFSITPDRKCHLLYRFDGGHNAGEEPSPGTALTLAPDGAFYGTTLYGGLYGFGSVFRLGPTGTCSRVASYTPATWPYEAERSTLAIGLDGSLYAVTSGIGGSGSAAVLRISRSGEITVLRRFGPAGVSRRPPGVYLNPGVLRDGCLYGAVGGGGKYGSGLLFRITPAGEFEVAYSFRAEVQAPASAPIEGGDGALYGLASVAGVGSAYYRLDRSGELTVLTVPDIGTNATPDDRLVRAADGTIYDPTMLAIYRIVPPATVQITWAWDANKTNFRFVAPAVIGTDGGMYAPAYGEPTGFQIARVAPDGSGTSTAWNLHGAGPSDALGPLAEAQDGTLYGEDSYGGDYGYGWLYRLFLGLPAYHIDRLKPNEITAGRKAMTLRVLGVGFAPGMSIQWDVTTLPTTHVSPTELDAQVPADQMVETGAAPVTVITPQGGMCASRLVVIKPR